MIDPSVLPTHAADDVAALSGQLARDGYAVLPGLYPSETVARLRHVVGSIYEALGAPPLFANPPQWPAETVEISTTGLVLHQLLGRSRALHRGLLDPKAIAVLRGALGEDMHLELTAALLCDHTRPFFEWHNHVGGIDDERYRRLGLRPEIERPERIAMLVYLDELREDSGQLLIYPRRVSGASAPPQDPAARAWEGQLAVEGPPGTVVMMDQCCWHAVLPCAPRETPRIFVGLWFAAAEAPPAHHVDASLSRVADPDALLASVLPRNGAGRA